MDLKSIGFVLTGFGLIALLVGFVLSYHKQVHPYYAILPSGVIIVLGFLLMGDKLAASLALIAVTLVSYAVYLALRKS